MKNEMLQTKASRTSDSQRFEGVLRRASMRELLPCLSDLDFQQISDLMPWVAMIRPNAVDHSLRITMAGCGFTEMQGHSLIDHDFLDFVDPAIKGDAFDSSFVMLGRPCGLWQRSAVKYFDDSESTVELTGFPVFDSVRGCGLLIYLIRNIVSSSAKLMTVYTAREWNWLDMRN